MVGKRTTSYKYTDNANGKHLNGGAPGGNIEIGGKSRPRPKVFSFRDVADSVVEDQQRNTLKRKLLEGINRNELEKFRKTDEELKDVKNKKVRQFYEEQNQRLNDWLEVDTLVKALADDILDSFNPDRDHDGIVERDTALRDIHEDIEALLPEDEQHSRRKEAKKARWAININVVANILLLIAKVAAVFFSSSLSLIASLVDSALDLLCTLIVWTTNKLVSWRLNSLQRKFPVGRRRLEPLGILVFSIIMVISFIQILQESVEKLLPSGDHSLANLPNVAIFAMVSTIVVKGIIGIGCYRIKTTQVQALVQDCKTDVFFNTLSLLFPLIGRAVDAWWLDPVGAAFLSLFIIYDWSQTCFENVTRLSGSGVDNALQSKLTFLAWRFSPVVDGFKSLKAYHAGDGVWVEVDVLLDGQASLMRTHDVAETLQYCLEGLRDVDRAFVTVDYTSQGPTGHASGPN
ncbi:hypothetical protein K402DRAFT_410507 [Aulographum hederae CBS 113979]|uniref:Cation efflux protein transmembrane domain-containing protein n=1 Tax=Aulographum hederae CBS 113979 TaxID=1176131 RepID=A0A6G1HBY7_9PEZI|nr:hypothetical protein K402DRAFT_410507 [Aulographum hederae CBS 113979]